MLGTNDALTGYIGGDDFADEAFRDAYKSLERARRGITEGTLTTALNISSILCNTGRHSEARAFSSKRIGESTRLLGPDHDLTLKFRSNYAMAVYKDPNSSLHDLTSAVETMEKVLRVRRRVFGHCPRTTREARKTEVARAVLAERHARETPTDELDEVENA